MRNIKLVVEYDGTGFAGWQIQQRARTIQQELTTVLHQVAQEEVNVIGAGRTDSGVHARGQVANFRTTSNLSTESFLNALNGLLPRDICVHSVEEVPEKFHARFDAKERVYRYFVSQRLSAINRYYSWFVKYTQDVNLMNQCAKILEGDHDFRAFCKLNPELSHSRCIVTASCWAESEGGFVYEIRANRFLHGMVRALVGTMVDVGRGYRTFEDFKRILESGARSDAGMSSPPHGLFLEAVRYDSLS